MDEKVTLTDEDLDNVVGGSHISSGDLIQYLGHTLTLTWGPFGCKGGFKCVLGNLTEDSKSISIFGH